ncbi:hypothetical protein FACS1894167_13720 [Synergistales bacterium]|nr:hypothetical protein FACS1894167_13720 [Synergistales bacterium]
MSRKQNENLMIVAAVEGYSFRHNMASKDAFDLFARHDILNLIRSQYDTLHTQGLDENISFAEDVIHSVTGA